MARIAHFRKILKDDFFKRIKFFAEFLSARDILDAAAAENYHWRERIWTPIQTLWAFLVQVLEPDCPCREAVARILAEQTQIRDEGGSLTMRIAYLHAIRDGPYFLGRPRGKGLSLRPKSVSSFAKNLSLPNGRPRLVHKRSLSSCRSSSKRVSSSRQRAASICFCQPDMSRRPDESPKPQCAAELLHCHRQGLRHKRALTGLRSTYAKARQR